jgi:hypothetical protein
VQQGTVAVRARKTRQLAELDQIIADSVVTMLSDVRLPRLEFGR